jgi:hypothetical protein
VVRPCQRTFWAAEVPNSLSQFSQPLLGAGGDGEKNSHIGGESYWPKLDMSRVIDLRSSISMDLAMAFPT